MTYGMFLLSFLVPSVVLITAVLTAHYRSSSQADRTHIRRGAVLIGLLIVLAVAYTTPWDRWLIQHSVWSYPPDSVIGTIYLVPIEEYLFMIGQTVLTGSWTVFVTANRATPVPALDMVWRRPAHATGWLLLAAIGTTLAVSQPHALYLGAIVGWFGPLLALQAIVGADVLRAARRARLAGLMITPLLWMVDAVAIHAGAWRISPDHIVGLAAFGLPMEEMVFFLVTNLLIVNSVVLVSSPTMRRRLAERLRPPAEHTRHTHN